MTGAAALPCAQPAWPAQRHLIVGGQKSGKSRHAEYLARDWLQAGQGHEAALIATGQPWDAEMQERIARHQVDRARRVPGLATIEQPLDLAQALSAHSAPHRLLVIDCLTLWLTNWLMPLKAAGAPQPSAESGWSAQCALFLTTLQQIPGPVILVGNEIGLGVIPMGREVRAFVDALGVLNQKIAAQCDAVSLMCAGLPLRVKGNA